MKQVMQYHKLIRLIIKGVFLNIFMQIIYVTQPEDIYSIYVKQTRLFDNSYNLTKMQIIIYQRSVDYFFFVIIAYISPNASVNKTEIFLLNFINGLRDRPSISFYCVNEHTGP